jgi:hypothetical protein
MVNYNQTKVYRIFPTIPHDTADVYIGSTTKRYLCDRMAHHVWSYKNRESRKEQSTTAWKIFDRYGVENCKIELIEACVCETADDKTEREAHYIMTTPCVNRNMPGRRISRKS